MKSGLTPRHRHIVQRISMQLWLERRTEEAVACATDRKTASITSQYA